MCDFLNDDFSNVFGTKRCTPDGEYYKLSKPESKYSLSSENMDKYTMVNKIEPKTIVIENSLRIDRHDVLLVLMLILILIVVKMLISMYKLNTQFDMLVMNNRTNLQKMTTPETPATPANPQQNGGIFDMEPPNF